MTEKISLNHITKRFGPILAVNNISMSVGSGEVLGFLGPNGAGKSTTMRMITGFIEPTSGSIEVLGMNVTQNPVEVKRSIGYLPEGAPTYGDMTAKSYLNFIAEIRGFKGADKRKRVETVINNVNIENIINQPIDTLSKGFKRRVGLAQSLLHDPEILIMDEPTDGLDPNQKHHVRTLIREMSKEKAIIISTHILEEVEAVCSRAVIIAHGRLLADGKPKELLTRATNHNAVIITMDKGKANEKLEHAIKAIPDVSSIEILPIDNEDQNVLQLRVIPKNSDSIAEQIGELLRIKDIPIHEMFIERGTLDDVFRKITAPEDFSDD